MGAVGVPGTWLAGPQADAATEMARTIPIEDMRMRCLPNKLLEHNLDDRDRAPPSEASAISTIETDHGADLFRRWFELARALFTTL